MTPITGTRKRASDGRDVLEVDYHAVRRLLVGDSASLSLVAGLAIDTVYGPLRVVRVGQRFAVSRGRQYRVYLYVEPAESADWSPEVIAARIQAANDARFARRRDHVPARLGDDAPIGWHD